MYDNETKNQFIELRANGLSLDAISAQLSVPKTTLGRWHYDSLEQIQRLRALQWHLLEDQIGQRLEDTLTRIAERIRKWDDKLDKQLGHYQKPGDSIRVIRESRREYLQLRSLLLAPLQPAGRNAPCLTSVAPEKRDKTGQNPAALDTTPLPPNDLQQPETSLSHFASSPEGPMPESATDFPSSLNLNHNLNRNLNPDPSSASPRLCVEISSDQSEIQNSKSKIPSSPPSSLNPNPNLNPEPSSASPRLCGETLNFLGSIVISPYECAAAVVLKTLEHEAAHRARQPASDSQLSTNNPQLTYELMRVDPWQ